MLSNRNPKDRAELAEVQSEDRKIFCASIIKTSREEKCANNIRII